MDLYRADPVVEPDERIRPCVAAAYVHTYLPGMGDDSCRRLDDVGDNSAQTPPGGLAPHGHLRRVA